MFDIIFGWRKASTCKKLIKKFRCRLKLVKNKRFTISRQLKEDIAHLLKNGYEQIAFSRLEHLYVDENMVAVYELLDQFSEFIILNLSYIRRHKDLPNDVNEAVSTLIFASARCGDLPELMHVRKLFRERYGHRLTTSAVELHPGNLVNIQVKEMLIQQSVPENVKNRLLDEIVRDFFFKLGVLALEYKPEFHVQPQKVTELCDVQKKEYSSPATNNSIVLHSSPPIIETPKQTEELAIVKLSTPYEYETDAVSAKKLDQSDKSGISSDCSNQYSEDSVIYLDDVLEFKCPTKQGMHCTDQDQRFFMFSFPSLCDNILSNRDTRRRDSEKIARTRTRRSVSIEKQTIDDLQCEIYFGYNRSNNGRKYQEKVQFEEKERFYLLNQGSLKLESRDCACRNRCSVHQPCYFCTNDYEDSEVILWREEQGGGNAVKYQVQGEETEGIGLTSPLPQTPIRDYKDSPLVSKCGTLALAPYVRAMTIPQRHQIEMQSTEISRSISLPVGELNGSRSLASPSHVHPKLPDYDEIAAKFRALKKVHQQNKFTRS